MSIYLDIAAVSTVIYGYRLGCLLSESSGASSNSPGYSGSVSNAEIQQFISAVQGLFQASQYVLMLPRKIGRVLLPKWQKLHDDSWKTIMETGDHTWV